jgi:hypothetical protein
MSFFWRHKFLSLFLISIIFFLLCNPKQRFGITKQGLVVFNRIPVAFFDIYIDPDGKLHLVEDLSKQKCFDDFVRDKIAIRKKNNRVVSLFVGTGFDSSVFSIEPNQENFFRDIGFKVRQVSSLRAVQLYNTNRDSGRTAAILLRVK